MARARLSYSYFTFTVGTSASNYDTVGFYSVFDAILAEALLPRSLTIMVKGLWYEPFGRSRVLTSWCQYYGDKPDSLN